MQDAALASPLVHAHVVANGDQSNVVPAAGGARKRPMSRYHPKLGASAFIQNAPSQTHRMVNNKWLVVIHIDAADDACTTFAVCDTQSEANNIAAEVVSLQNAYICPPQVVTKTVKPHSFRFMVSDPAVFCHTVEGPTEASLAAAVRVDATKPWPDDRVWHKVIISDTVRPTKKNNMRPLNPDVQTTRIKAMVRAEPDVLYPMLAKSAPRPPADPNLYLEWHLSMSEKGHIAFSSHKQTITILWSAYPVTPVPAMQLAMARRARGETRRIRERAIRMQQEKLTVDAYKMYTRLLPWDRSDSSLNTVIRVADLASENRMKTYASKDYGEDHCVHAGIKIDESGVERPHTHEELLALSEEAHVYAASDRNAYKKVLDAKHLYLSEANADMRVAAYRERNRRNHLMTALETEIKNMLIEKVAKLDLKGLPKIKESRVTESVRKNLMHMIEEDPRILIDDPDIICEVWSGDREAIRHLDAHDGISKYRSERNLPSLDLMHQQTPLQFAHALKVGRLGNDAIPMPRKAFDGRMLIVDYNLTGGCASDVARIAQQDNFDSRQHVSSHLLSIERTSYAAAAVAEHLLRAGNEFWSFSAPTYASIKNDCKDHIVSRFNEEFHLQLCASDCPAIMATQATEEFISTVVNSNEASPLCVFVGVLTYGTWRDAFVDSITHADDDSSERTVHIAAIRNDNNGHTFIVAWQLSRERNDSLLESEMRQCAEDAGVNLGDDADADNAMDEAAAASEAHE